MTDQIIATKDQVGTYDAIETAKPGEPLFPLQGGDPVAPDTVLFWAEQTRAFALTLSEDDKRRAKLLRKATDAEAVAWAMRDYQAGEAQDPAEAMASVVDSYTGAVAPAEGAWRPGIVAGVRFLAEAAAAFSDAAEHLPGDQAAALRVAVEKIKATADRYRPKRASYSANPEFPTGG